MLSVMNDGARVPSEEVQQLFQPFQPPNRARANHQNGHGFGLSIVSAIATAHGATIRASSPPEGGFAVEVSFPMAPSLESSNA